MNKKIVVTGNKNYGLAASIAKFMEADFFSRSNNGFDFNYEEKRKEFSRISLNYDVFINCSALWKFQQTLLLEQVYKTWRAEGHRGLIINLGSSADTPVKGTDWVYPIEKKALKAYTRNLSMVSLGGPGSEPSGIRITYISPGYISTPHIEAKHPGVKKLDPDYLAKVILWVVEQPENVNINEISVDPIQI